MFEFHVGDLVRKADGYEFSGVVQAVFQITEGPREGEMRIVVMSTVPGARGLMHIFNASQLTRVFEGDHGG